MAGHQKRWCLEYLIIFERSEKKKIEFFILIQRHTTQSKLTDICILQVSEEGDKIHTYLFELYWEVKKIGQNILYSLYKNITLWIRLYFII